MSYYDPYYLYTHHQRHSHKGQVIQKRPVKVNYAATQRDLEHAIEIAKAYGYVVHEPGWNPPVPVVAELHTISGTYHPHILNATQNLTFNWSNLNDYVNSSSILQNAPEGVPFNITISLWYVTFRIQKGSPANTIKFTTKNYSYEQSINYSMYCAFLPYNETSLDRELSAQNQTFNISTNVTQVQYTEGSGPLNQMTLSDIQALRTSGLPETAMFSITNSSVSSYATSLNALITIEINAIY